MQNLCRELVRRLRRADARICQMASAVSPEEDHTQLNLRVLARSVP
jgi:hypothetical protein